MHHDAGAVEGRHDPAFAAFFRVAEPRLRRALVAAYGAEVGREATADALAWAWAHWDRVASMRNPAGYLYRVGQSAARRYRKDRVVSNPETAPDERHYEPGLDAALARLTEQQRVAVLLVVGQGETLADAAAVLGIRVSTVRNHVARAMRHLRDSLGVSDAID